MSDATRSKHSERQKRLNAQRWADPEARERQASAIARTHEDEALKMQRAASIRATMATPDFKQKRSLLSKMLVSRVRLTNIRKGNVRESAGELELVAWLRTMFVPCEVVHHPERVQGADIDIYVAPIDTYVQFDGVYYHGLDRPYADLSPVIRRKFDRDRAVDALFKRLGLRLLRITDQEWHALRTDEARAAWLAQVKYAK